MSDLGGVVRSYLARRKRAEGGEVDADDMIDAARDRLASQATRRVLPDVGEPLVGNGGEFSPGARWANKAADIGGKLVSGMAHGIATLPRRAIENSQYSLNTGDYDPRVPVEAAMMTMGTGAVAGVPVKGAEAVLGAGPIRKKGGIDVAEPAAAETRLDVGSGLAGPSGGAEGVRAAELQAERRAGERQPLEGLPRGAQIVEGEPFIPGPVARVHDVADRYMADKDFGVPHPDKFHPIDVDHAKAIAQAFEDMPHAPNDPKVKAAYDALAQETKAQYEAIVEHGGLKVTPAGVADYPYHGNPRAVAKDVADNNHMAFFKSDEGFGSTPIDLVDQPMLRSSGIKVGDHDMLYNDLFRVVHDYFGHVKNGNGFRGAGEDNAWRAHAAMYSPEARRAMTTETRGQNSWLNYGPHGDFNRTANGADTIYAQQKVGLLPDWVMHDRRPEPAVAWGDVEHVPTSSLRPRTENTEMIEKFKKRDADAQTAFEAAYPGEKYNPKPGDARYKVDEIRKRIRAGDELPPLAVHRNGLIEDGENRWRAYQAEGHDTVPVRKAIYSGEEPPPVKRGPRYYEGEPITNAGVDAKPNRKIQTVADPHRMMFPGIYRNPRLIAEEAASRVGPEDPAMKQLFGVTRGDLREMAQGRVGNEEPKLSLADNPRGAISAQNIQTPKNTQRLVDILGEAGKHEGLRTADAWYIHDPMYKRLEEMFGPEEAARRYKHLNTTTSMASPGSDVLTEIQRGTGAHWLQQQGRFGDFLKYAGLTGDAKNSLKVPRDVRYIQGHPYHRTSMGEPMEKYFNTGEIQSKKAKVPLYAHASGVPETGFQTTGPVGDAHFSRGVGLSDTRKGPSNVEGSFSRPEYQTLQPWWQHDVAGKVGLESVPAQARLWTTLGPQTGVESALGAPKLELFAKQIAKAARRLGVSPEKARDMILSGKAGAGVMTGAAVLAPRAFRDDERAAGGRVMKGYEEGGDVVDQAPTFDPAKLAAASAPAFDPAKLAAVKPKQPKSIGEKLGEVWANPSPGGPVWMAKELYEGVKGSVDASKRATTAPETEGDAYLQGRATQDAADQARRAAAFLTPVAPRGTGGIFAAPMRDAAAAKLVSPEAQANRGLAKEFDFNLSRGQATQDLDQIRYEDMAARGAYGKDAQDRAAPFFDRQYQDIQGGTQNVGQTLARGEQPLGSPRDAAASLNTEVSDSAARMAQMRDAVTARAEQAAASRREGVTERGRALDQNIGLTSPREAAEAVNTGVRDAATANRNEFRSRYDEFGRLPGEFDVSAVRGMGNRIRNELTYGENPVIIDEGTPAASRAIQALDEMSQPRITNLASPHAAPDPQDITAVSLRGVDQMRKRLVGYYQQARANPSDARAMRSVMEGFDNQIERAITENLFSGDPRALQALREARASYSRYRSTFGPRNAGDDVGTAMRRIVDRNATPEETANMIIGSGQIGNAGLPVRIADRLEQVLGADSPEFQGIRQAMWQKVSQVRNRAGEIDPQGSARAIEQLANSSLGTRMFPEERAAMRAHARGIRDLDHVIESLPETAAAEQARNIYQQAFGGEGLSGSQRAVFRRMVDGTATPEETAQVIFNAIGSGNPGDAVRVLQAIGRIVGPESPVMGTVRQGVWQKLTQEPFGKDQKGQQKMVQAVNEFVNGKGSGIAKELYSREERQLMQRFADAVRLTIIPKYARTNSDTAPALLAAVRKYAGVVGSALGAVFHGGMSGGAEGYAATKAVDFAASKIGLLKERRKLSDSLEDVIPKPKRPMPMRGAAERAVIAGVAHNPYAP